MSLDENSKKMCRACLTTDESSSQLISLFSGGCAASEVPKKMMNISKLFMHKEDGLPSMICLKCVFLVKVTDCFKKQIQLADKELRGISVGADDTEETNGSMKTPVLDSSDSEIEDLAYNPEYISDEVKAEVESAFKRKHQMIRNREYRQMSNFLKNLGRKTFFPVNTIKKEMVKTKSFDDTIVNDSREFNKTDFVENGYATDKKLGGKFHDDRILESGTLDDVAIKTENIDSNESEKLDNDSEKVKNVYKEKEAVNIAHSEVERNINQENVNPNVVVITDSSDDAGPKSDGKSLKPPREKLTLKDIGDGDGGGGGRLELFQQGEKRKLNSSCMNEPLIEQPIIKEMPAKIKVMRLNEIVERAKSSKIQQPKLQPRTFFLCTSCNVRLQSVSAVLLHHNQVHSPNKNSRQCRMCNKLFPTKNQLLEHFNQHVETHLFRCSYCPNEFVLKDNLTRHMINHTKVLKNPLEVNNNERMTASNENLPGDIKIEESAQNVH